MEPISFSAEPSGSRGSIVTKEPPINEESTACHAFDLTDPQQFLDAARAAETRLRAYLLRGPQSADTDDIIQATWLAAWEHRNQFHGRGSPTGWFFRISQSIARQTRGSFEKVRTVPIATDFAAEQSVSESGELARVALEDDRLSLIESLSYRRRTMLLARFQHGLSMAEIAARFGCRIGTVRATIHQALQTLRRADRSARERSQGQRDDDDE